MVREAKRAAMGRSPVNTKVEVNAHPDWKYGAWRGGSILAALKNEWRLSMRSMAWIF